ncbi:DUF445 domain-containing protein [Bacillus sp. RG28]|uniref:DUF445 domain-containing protein n=1 Tax=Gottfriedia endophytica TaxID=2820819 RepID=A0A940NN98_9BACI|nr:DUF445 domain-containing protein [Gottfriedia endophytica]MBP0725279.1 DUF445 domain-containing protein [Gottfriedia endophytica]
MSKKERKSKYLAKISLGVMTVGFLASLPFQDSFIGRLLQGGFEAGLVGGLADWFAVTALFRHPLGIPIPHTALLPKNRDRMIRGLISMLENDWLTKESIRGKIKQINFSDMLMNFAYKELHSSTFKKGIASILKQIINNVDIEKVAPIIEKELKAKLNKVDVTAILQPVIHQTISKKVDERALDYLLNETGKWMVTEEAKLKMGTIAKQLLDNIEADGFMKFAINSFVNLLNEEKIGSILQSFFLSRISMMQRSDNEFRELLLTRIRKELESIQDREELIAELNQWKNSFINDWNPSVQITDMLKQLQNKLLLLIEDEAFIEQHVISFIKNFLDHLNSDPVKMENIENWVQNQIVYLIEQNHSKIGELVKENLEKLDNETLINMMENNVGKDLQWIRVNGAICGFIIGLILTIFKVLI